MKKNIHHQEKKTQDFPFINFHADIWRKAHKRGKTSLGITMGREKIKKLHPVQNLSGNQK